MSDERTFIPVGDAPPVAEAPWEPEFRDPDGHDDDSGHDGGNDGSGGDDGSFDEGRPPRPRVYKLRLALIVGGLATLAFLSTVFGMLMAVASDLPALENRQEYKHSANSILLDTNGQQIGVLTGNENRILIQPGDVSASMQHAIIAIEDKRFFENNGIDIRGIGRALFADLTRQKAVQGASTITQQFVKNALAAQQKRTVFEKLREAALAYHLTRKWSKQKILTEYLNTVYFGNGAYGIESAARTYFGTNHLGCGNQGQPYCASLLTPAESAELAGMVASPAAWDPLAHPEASKMRRNVVLAAMLQGGSLTRGEYDQSINAPLPNASSITLPRENSQAPYFTSWVKEQVIDRFGAQRALAGGLRIRTTLDLQLQAAADQAVANHLTDPNGPAAALVAIDNRTGAVRAMVGGRPGVGFNDAPFNLATQGQRQPGSSFKIFVLAQALRSGYGPDSTIESKQKIFTVPNSGGKEKFVVNNFEGQYAGVRTLADATAESDNSVFAEVGFKVGLPKIASLAQQMGIRTPVSHNPAISLGGLKQGVTPLDMAHGLQTIAAGGSRVTGSLAAQQAGPVGIADVKEPNGHVVKNQIIRKRVVSKKLAETETSMLQGVVSGGTGTSASTGGFAAGKTGTTENYGDAWFVGFNKRWTVAVWVGYPDSVKAMKYDYNGGPVVGGSYPAEIWHDFIVAADDILNTRLSDAAARTGRTYTPPDGSSSSGTSTDSGSSGSGSSSGSTSGSSGSSQSGSSGSTGGGGSSGGGSGGGGGSTGGGGGGGSGGGGSTGGGGGGGSTGGGSAGPGGGTSPG